MIDDDKMIDIAENCLVKIAEGMIDAQTTVYWLFGDQVQQEEIQGQLISLLSPIAFLEGVSKL